MWVWANSGRWQKTGKFGVLQSMGSQRVGYEWSNQAWQRLQHARLPRPSLSPKVCTNSCPLTWWCHPIISSFVAPFSACPQFVPTSGYFPMSRLFALGGQSIGASGWFPLGLNGFISLLSKGLSSVFHYSSKASILWCSAFFMVQLSHPYMTPGKTIALTTQTFVSKIMSLVFNILSRLVIAFLPRSECLLILWLQSLSAVILEPKKINSVTVSIVSPSVCHEMMELGAMILVFWLLSLSSGVLIAGVLITI